jgi:hypothetical protein
VSLNLGRLRSSLLRSLRARVSEAGRQILLERLEHFTHNRLELLMI